MLAATEAVYMVLWGDHSGYKYLGDDPQSFRSSSNHDHDEDKRSMVDHPSLKSNRDAHETLPNPYLLLLLALAPLVRLLRNIRGKLLFSSSEGERAFLSTSALMTMLPRSEFVLVLGAMYTGLAISSSSSAAVAAVACDAGLTTMLLSSDASSVVPSSSSSSAAAAAADDGSSGKGDCSEMGATPLDTMAGASSAPPTAACNPVAVAVVVLFLEDRLGRSPAWCMGFVFGVEAGAGIGGVGAWTNYIAQGCTLA